MIGSIAKGGKLMENIITKLAEIEAAASRIMDSVSEQKLQLARDHEAAVEAFDRKVDQETQSQVKEIQEQLEIRMKQELESQKAATEAKLAHMEHYYQEHHRELAENIYERIIRKG